MADVIGPVLQFKDLQTLSGYERAADVERWAQKVGLAVKPTRNGVASSIDAWNAALGIAANRDTYAVDSLDAPIDWLRENYAKFLYSPAHILKNAIPFGHKHTPGLSSDIAGIYFLIDDNEVVYAGLSSNVSSRIAQHFYSGKRFTHYWHFGGVPVEFLPHIEAFYIHAFEPSWNVKYPPMNEHATQYVAAYKAGTMAWSDAL